MFFPRFLQHKPSYYRMLINGSRSYPSWIERRTASKKPFCVGVVGSGPAGSFVSDLLASGAESLVLPAYRCTLRKIFNIKVFETRDTTIAKGRGCGLGSGMFIAEDFLDLEFLESLRRSGTLIHPIKNFSYSSPAGSFDLDMRCEFPEYSLYATNRNTSTQGASLDFSIQRNLINRENLEFYEERIIKVERMESGKIKLLSADEDRNSREHMVDYVIGAFGVDPMSASMFQTLIPEYRPPALKRMVQREILIKPEYAEEIGGTVYVFAIPTPPEADYTIHFLAMTPKVSFSGETSITATMRYVLKKPDVKVNPAFIFDYAITHPLVVRRFPDRVIKRLECLCTPLSVVAQGEHVTGDGAAVIGDCGLSPRLYKNGLAGAFISARFLAETMLLHGPDHEVMYEKFESKMKSQFDWRNWCGSVTANMYDHLNMDWDAFGSVLSEIIKYRSGRQALAAIATGTLSYPDILLRFALMGSVGAMKAMATGKVGPGPLLRLLQSASKEGGWARNDELEDLFEMNCNRSPD